MNYKQLKEVEKTLPKPQNQKPIELPPHEYYLLKRLLPEANQASEGVGVDIGVSESADLAYHGATFTEEGGKLSITGDQIPESFWNYYHSGGRGRNSAHKRAMKDAGWEYTFRGKPRIYTFSITVDRFNAWKLANPDDGSQAVELSEQGSSEQVAMLDTLRAADIETKITDPGSPWRDDAVHFILTDGVSANVRRTDHRGGVSYRAYEVSFWGDALERSDQHRVKVAWHEIGVAMDDASNHENKEKAITAALAKLNAVDLKLKQPEPEVPVTPEAEGELREQILQGVLTAYDKGTYSTKEGDTRADIEGIGEVKFSLIASATSSYMPGEGLTAPEYHRKLSISSTASPQAFKYFSIDMPDTVREAYDAQFREEVLDDLQDMNNWERIGRKNAFKHTTGAAVNILKDGNVYKATFTDLHNKGVYFTSVTGDTLTARLENALQKLHPNEFAYSIGDRYRTCCVPNSDRKCR